MSSEKRPIRSIAIVTPFYPPHVGGIERYSQEFARAAVASGLSVSVITTDNCRRPVEAVEDGIRIMRLPARNLPIMGSHYPIAVSGWGRATDLLRCDAVIAQTRFFMTTLAAAAILARERRRIWVIDHGAGPLRQNSRLFAFASMAYEHAATAALKMFSPRFLAVSRASARWLQTFGVRDARVLPNGVAPRTVVPRRSANSFGSPVIFYGGRLFPEKGVRELVEAVELLAAGGIDIRLRIAGEGPLSEFLRKRTGSNGPVLYLGRLSAEQVADELERCSIFVNASNLPEGFPTVLLEAGSAALPVISTVRGGSADLIVEDATGWSISVGEPEQIAARIREVLASPEEAVRRGKALFDLVQQRYTWPVIVNRFLGYAEDGASS